MDRALSHRHFIPFALSWHFPVIIVIIVGGRGLVGLPRSGDWLSFFWPAPWEQVPFFEPFFPSVDCEVKHTHLDIHKYVHMYVCTYVWIRNAMTQSQLPARFVCPRFTRLATEFHNKNILSHFLFKPETEKKNATMSQYIHFRLQKIWLKNISTHRPRTLMIMILCKACGLLK